MARRFYWRLIVSYPDSLWSAALDAKLIALVGKDRADSGHGFSLRDIGWVFDKEAKDRDNELCAKEARDRVLRANLPGVDVDVVRLVREA